MARIQMVGFTEDGRQKDLQVERTEELATLVNSGLYSRLVYVYGKDLVVERLFPTMRSRSALVRLHLCGDPFWDFKVSRKNAWEDIDSAIHGTNQSLPWLSETAGLKKHKPVLKDHTSNMPDLDGFTFIENDRKGSANTVKADSDGNADSDQAAELPIAAEKAAENAQCPKEEIVAPEHFDLSDFACEDDFLNQFSPLPKSGRKSRRGNTAKSEKNVKAKSSKVKNGKRAKTAKPEKVVNTEKHPFHDFFDDQILDPDFEYLIEDDLADVF